MKYLERAFQNFIGFEAAGGQIGDEFAIGGEEIVIGEFFGQNPGDVLVDDGRDIWFGKLSGEEVNFELLWEIRVLVKDFGNFATFGEGDAELFAKLAREGLLEGFIGMNLATGKFPLQSRGIIVAALADEDAAVGAFDDGGYDKHDGFT